MAPCVELGWGFPLLHRAQSPCLISMRLPAVLIYPLLAKVLILAPTLPERRPIGRWYTWIMPSGPRHRAQLFAYESRCHVPCAVYHDQLPGLASHNCELSSCGRKGEGIAGVMNIAS